MRIINKKNQTKHVRQHCYWLWSYGLYGWKESKRQQECHLFVAKEKHSRMVMAVISSTHVNVSSNHGKFSGNGASEVGIIESSSSPTDTQIIEVILLCIHGGCTERRHCHRRSRNCWPCYRCCTSKVPFNISPLINCIFDFDFDR